MSWIWLATSKIDCDYTQTHTNSVVMSWYYFPFLKRKIDYKLIC